MFRYQPSLPITLFFRVFVLTVVCGLLALLLFSCNSDYTPKPRGYFQIHFPKKQYQSFNQTGYPYSFEYPVYAKVVKDSSFFGDSTENPWWINIEFPQFNSRIYISYKDVRKYKFDKLINDSYKLTNKNTVKAYSIDDSLITNPNNVHGIFFKLGGDVATANQFLLTDTTRHFIRGALYFDATPNEDSSGIVNRFLIEDVKHLINTFNWKK